MSERRTLQNHIIHQVYAEDWLAFAGLVIVTREAPVLASPPSDMRLDAAWASERRLMVHGRPYVRKCETFDWSGSSWVAVAIPEDVAAHCVERVSESAPVGYTWYRYALRSLAYVGPKGDRSGYRDWVSRGREDEWLKRGSPEWSEERVAMVSDVLGLLRPFVSDRGSLLQRGSLLVGMTMGCTSDLFPKLDDDEMAEVARRVP